MSAQRRRTVPARVTTLIAALVLPLAGLAAVVAAPAAQAAAIPAVDADIHISEVFADGGAASGTDAGFPTDFIELTNGGAQDEDVTGWILKDDTDAHSYVIGTGDTTVIPAGGSIAYQVGATSHAGNFGLGNGGDAARVFDGTTLVDQFWFTAASGDGNDYSRCAITATAFAVVKTTGITPNAANTCPTPATALATVKGMVKVNEVQPTGANGTDSKQLTDWIELVNTGTYGVNLAGWWLNDNGGTSDKDVFAAQTYLGASTGSSPTKPAAFAAYAVGGQASAQLETGVTYPWGTTKTGSDFGLGGSGDEAALVAPDGTDADRVGWGSDGLAAGLTAPAAGGSISRCPDGAGSWAQSFAATPSATNSCANPTDSIVKINEVDLTDKVVELVNTSTTTVANLASGYTLTDTGGTPVTISSTSTTVDGVAGTSIPAGHYAEVAYGDQFAPAAAGDTVTLKDGTTSVDASTWAATFSHSWGRCPDGTGSFTSTGAITDGAASTAAGANNCATGSTAGYGSIRVSEVETNGAVEGDWIELANTSGSAVNLSGAYLADNGGVTGSVNGSGDPTVFPTDSSHSWQIPGTTTDPTDTTTAGNTVIPAHGFVTFYANTQFIFGLGGPDQARFFSPTKALVDAVSWTAHEAGVTYERCPGVTQNVQFTDTADGDAFINSFDSTPSAANDCTPPIRINEVQASDAAGGPDWVELTNVGTQPVDLSGWVLTDDKDADGDVIPSGTTLNPGAFVTFEPNNEDGLFTGSTPTSAPFGLGATGDEVRLYQATAWSGTAYVAGDLVDSFVFENAATKSGGAVQQQTTLANGSLAGGPWPVNATTPASPETYARCVPTDGSKVVADGNGGWAATSTPTRGASNACDGLFQAQPWPDTHHGQADTTADNVDLGQNMSGLDYVDAGTPGDPSDDFMWGIENGSSGLAGANPGDGGSLFKLVPDADGMWGPAAGWEKGVPVRYLNNATGEVDAEGVTATDGKVYVTSERDNTNSNVSKIAVLEVDPKDIVAHAGDVDGDLDATHEWDLTDLMPPPGGGVNPETGLDSTKPGDANLGIEGVTFVPDSALVAEGFKDEHTNAAYDPTTYPDHVDGGLFFVALEKTGKLYGYEFNSDNTWTRVATVDTGFQTIQDLMWDSTLNQLRATCDNGCQGRQSVLAIDTANDANKGTFGVQDIYSRPTGAVDNLNNEGFAQQPDTECVAGSKSVFWSDDTDDGNHWLRTASLDCTGQQVLRPGPVIGGSGKVGTPLTATVGTWDSGTATAYQWLDGNAVLATDEALAVTPALDGHTITLAVTSTKVDFAPVTTTATTTVIDGDLTAVTPTIDKTSPKVGDVLTATVGAWSPNGASLATQWSANGTVISGATGGSLTITPALVGETITVSVTGTLTGYTSSTKTSAATAAVAAGSLVTVKPTLSGTVQVGRTLTATPGSWGPGAVALTYRWTAGGATIPGATGRTLVLKAAQYKKAITVVVTGIEGGYGTVSSTSTSTAAVKAGALATAAPKISGTLKVGRRLVAAPGTWLAGASKPALAYQWYAGGKAIRGATHAGYTLRRAQRGKRITVRVTGAAIGYTTATRSSASTRAVKPR
ncbi:MAG TPA: lamin tail domain-containing protein [Marmoricola sp.]|nr:lamin tail domain-containing protein [Marmoricola sp.]